MSDDQLDTEGLCTRLNALALAPGLDTLTLPETVTAWWDGWTTVAHTTGNRATRYVLTRDNVWVWLTIEAGQRQSVGGYERSGVWEKQDKHARAMALFDAIRDCTVTDYTGVYLLAVAAKRTQATMRNVARLLPSTESHVRIGSAETLLNRLDAANPGIDRNTLNFLAGLQQGPDAQVRA